MLPDAEDGARLVRLLESYVRSREQNSIAQRSGAQALAALGRAVVAASLTEPAPSGADGATDSTPKHAEAPEVL